MVNVKNSPEIEMMRISGRLLAQVLRLVEQAVRPGISTFELNAIAEEFIKKHNAAPTFKGYGGFPAALCT